MDPNILKSLLPFLFKQQNPSGMSAPMPLDKGAGLVNPNPMDNTPAGIMPTPAAPMDPGANGLLDLAGKMAQPRDPRDAIMSPHFRSGGGGGPNPIMTPQIRPQGPMATPPGPQAAGQMNLNPQMAALVNQLRQMNSVRSGLY